jgi:pyrimidine-nucleoside phosphorylase
MKPAEIIAKKRDGKELTPGEITYFISKFTQGEIPEYQMSALLMAIFFKSMTAAETAALTTAMLDSGDRVIFDPGDRSYADKHSSGGIGDKVSIILAPLMACCGLKIPMLSGRGLGHTGGTLDKLESIPGYRTDLSIDKFKQGVEEIGCIITGQTPEIAPADRKMYALRDVTGTIESIPLICGSILSKKFAAGPNTIVFDIKCGNGAFMKAVEDADKLGKSLCEICANMGKESAYLITDMNQPLGRAAGNGLEIDECLAALKGHGPDDLMQVTFSLGESMLKLGGIASGDDAISMQMEKVSNGSAFDKFLEMVEYQEGDTKKLKSGNRLQPALKVFDVNAADDGYVGSIDSYRIGRLIIEMGGGRTVAGQAIDHTVGVILKKKISDPVKADEPIIEVHSSGTPAKGYLVDEFRKCFKIAGSSIRAPELIIRE